MAKKTKSKETSKKPTRKSIPLKDPDKLVVDHAFMKFQLAKANLDHAIAMAKIRDLEIEAKKADENIAQVTKKILTDYGVSTKNSIALNTWQIVPPKGQEFIIEE